MTAITNEMLYDLLKESKADNNRQFGQVQQQFVQVQQQFVQVQQQFSQIRAELKESKADTNRQFEQIRAEHKEFKEDIQLQFAQVHETIREFKDEYRRTSDEINRQLDRLREIALGQERRLEKVYESRDKVTVNFTKTWALASLFMSIFAAIITLAIEKAF